MKINLNIVVKSLLDKIFDKEYILKVNQKFVENTEKKKSGLMNNINWFVTKIGISNKKHGKINEKLFIKWSIFYIN